MNRNVALAHFNISTIIKDAIGMNNESYPKFLDNDCSAEANNRSFLR